MKQDDGVAALPPLCGPTGGADKSSPAKPAAANAFTPGPWMFTGLSDVRTASGELVADTYSGGFTRNGELDRKRGIANARLVAAAPDYAEAAPTAADLLEQYADYIRRDVKADDLERHPYLPLIEQAVADLRAAIAKARGEAL